MVFLVIEDDKQYSLARIARNAAKIQPLAESEQQSNAYLFDTFSVGISFNRMT